MERTLLLEVRSGPDAGRSFAIAAGANVIVGRAAPSGALLPGDLTVSRRHFFLSFDGRDARIRDLESSHGTTVNGSEVSAALVGDGDLIGAGTTLIRLRLVAIAPPGALIVPLPDDPSASSHPASPTIQALGPEDQDEAGEGLETPSPVATAPDRVLAILRAREAPLFAILDAARDLMVHRRIHECPEAKASLYEGERAADLAVVAPHLIALPKGSPFLELLVRESWGRSWGVFLTSDRPFEDVREHLRRLLTVERPDGKRVLFRFYDPRVLKDFLPSCAPDERNAFFDAIVGWLVEDGGSLLEFALAGPRLNRQAHAVGEPAADAGI